MVFLIVGLAAGIAYVLLQAYYIYHWQQVPIFLVPPSFKPQKGISIIIVAHNEEKTIASCVNGILQQNFPQELIEVIVIDDRSTDSTAEIVHSIDHPSLTSYNLNDHPSFIHPPAYKKSGIELGVHIATHKLIAVTDADCNHNNDWLRTIAFVMDKKDLMFLTAPVLIGNADTHLEKMQAMENLSLMLITGAGIESKLHHIANGANMAFRKNAFLQVKGFEGNYQYASGDDMFLIEKMYKQYPDQIAFLKSRSAVVTTEPKNNWPVLLKQRIRWARKNKGLASPLISSIWLFVGFYHLFIICCLIACFFDLRYAGVALLLVILKWSADYLMIRSASRFFHIPLVLSEFFHLQILYAVYVVRLGWDMITGKKGDW